MKNFNIAVAAFALLAVTACDRRNEPGRYEESRPTVDANRQDSETKVEETYQAPGEIGKTERETGKVDVQTRKETVTTEVEKEKESIPSVGITTHRADINRMDQDDWVALGVPANTAKRIVDYREKNGEFRSVEDLSKVPGLNPTWISSMKGKLGIAESKSSG